MKRNSSSGRYARTVTRHSPEHHGLSVPRGGGIWKRVSDGVEFEVMGNGWPLMIRELGSELEPVKITDLEAFYNGYRFQRRAV